MNDEELEGVIAHELSHVRNYDILTTSIAATLAGAITWGAHMARWGLIFRRLRRARTRPRGRRFGRYPDDLSRAGRGDVAAARHFAHPGISSRRFRREHGRPSRRADSRAGKIGRLQPAYSDGCFAIHCFAFHRLAVPACARHSSGLFSTHPPLADRIAALRNMTITRS